MESKGISLGALVDKMKEGLEATRTTNAAILISNSGKIEKAEEQGIIEVPDFHARHKYIETASKWLGVDKPIDEPTQPTNQQNNFYFTPDQTNRLLED